MSQQFPSRPHFQLLRRHAKAVLRLGRLLDPSWHLADAQQALSRGYGLASWEDLKRYVASSEGDGEASHGLPGRGLGQSDSQSSAPPAAIIGRWLSRDAVAANDVALEIGGGVHSLLLTQVISPVEGPVVANRMTIRPDGCEHVLPFGDGMTLQADWKDSQTLRTVVRRDGIIAVEGSYVVSSSGASLVVTLPGSSREFGRVRNAAGQQRLARASRLAMLLATTMTLAAGGCAAVGSQQVVGRSLDRVDVDRRAIEALNQHDIAAALAADVNTVISQWSDDFVLLPSAGPIVRGKASNAERIEKARPLLNEFVPIAYEVDFEEIAISGDLAFAWGRFRGVARVRTTGKDSISSGKLLRIYQRQPDGRWLMHRTMSTSDGAAQ